MILLASSLPLAKTHATTISTGYAHTANKDALVREQEKLAAVVHPAAGQRQEFIARGGLEGNLRGPETSPPNSRRGKASPRSRVQS
jgi:hypothetical protein